MTPELNINSTVSIALDVVSCDLIDEAAILNMKDGVYYGLNPVGARIWNLIQEPMVVKEILETLVGEYDVDEETCRTDLMALLGQLLEKELIKLE